MLVPSTLGKRVCLLLLTNFKVYIWNKHLFSHEMPIDSILCQRMHLGFKKHFRNSQAFINFPIFLWVSLIFTFYHFYLIFVIWEIRAVSLPNTWKIIFETSIYFTMCTFFPQTQSIIVSNTILSGFVLIVSWWGLVHRRKGKKESGTLREEMSCSLLTVLKRFPLNLQKLDSELHHLKCPVWSTLTMGCYGTVHSAALQPKGRKAKYDF
jgi:hypothetical protein